MGAPRGFDSDDGLSREELRQRLHSLDAILARAPVPIAIAHDPECRFISANRALAELLELPADANFSLTPPEGQRPRYRIQRGGKDIPPDELPMQYAIAHRTSVSNEIEIVCGSGRVVHVQNDIEPLYDTHGNIYGCVSVCVDVTARKLGEIALRDADRRKDEFLATLSHELRNPLAPIRTALEVMRFAPENAAVTEQARATIERQLLHLVRITDDLLDLARITRNIIELRRERIDLCAAVQSAVEAIHPFIESREQRLAVQAPGPIWVDADLTRVSQIFSNLLNNASKYTAHGGEIRFSACVEGTEAVALVEDTGIGIPFEMLPRVFDMFTQLQAHRDRTHGGLGIGLTLARRLVELHGGSIEAASEGPGRGSRFTVRMPLSTRDARPATRERTGGAEHVDLCRVLVADDNPDSAEMMRLMFGLKGHEVRVAADGLQAVDLAREFRPDIAFLDIGMPRMDGYEAAQRIRGLGRPITLVALTGWGQDEDKQRSREAGFDHHLTKPPESEVLDNLIAGCRPRA